jgi:hypothetical protein
MVVLGQNPEQAADPATAAIAPAPEGVQRPELLSWNVADAREISPGGIRADFRPKWVRYLDSDGAFKTIETTLAPTGDRWCMMHAPFTACFPSRSSGTAVFHNNNRFNVADQSIITDDPLDLEIQVLGADTEGHLETGELTLWNKVIRDAQYVIYRDVFPNTDLIYYIDWGTAP